MALDDVVKKYVITSAQCNARVNKQFLKSLDTYCSMNSAELLILPMQGKNIHEDQLDAMLQMYSIIDGDLKLNDKIKIKDYKVKPQAIRPLTGLEPLVKGDKSSILAGTKINWRAVANSNTRMAKLLMTTGAVTHPNYNTDHRIGKFAKTDHEYGAIIVEVTSNKSYHVRYVEALKNGKFQDMETIYNGEETEQRRVNSIVVGDVHTGVTDKKALAGTLDMIVDLQPKNIFIHDLFNGSSISHHDIGDIVERNYNYKKNKLSLETEIKKNVDMLKTFLKASPDDSKIYVVASNHNEVINRYLKEGRFIDEPQNVELGCELLNHYLQGKNPLEEAIKKYWDMSDRIVFLKRGEDLRIRGYYMSEHGDKGPNGSRGNPRAYDKTLEKSITGHTHSSYKYRHTVKAGTISELEQRYNRGGTSSWIHSNVILYDNGKTSIVNIIDGKYRSD